jgi:endonuclease-3
MVARRTRLQRLLATLQEHQGGAITPPSRDPWHLILQENVVYLASDSARAAAFAALRKATGLEAGRLETCPESLLAAAAGRMAGNQVRKLRECAALYRTAGDPRELVRLPAREARKALKRFPGIGDPGADKLLLFAGRQETLALDSNGLRVLLRLGYGSEAGGYARSYRSAQQAAEAELPGAGPPRIEALVQAHLSLRAHGQETCRRTVPACVPCPLRDGCPGRLV